MSSSDHTDSTGKKITCPTCGLKYPLSAKFCGQDGTVLFAPSQATGTIGAKHCPQCKVVYPAYVQFCPVDSAVLLSNSGETGLQSKSGVMPPTPPAPSLPPASATGSESEFVSFAARIVGKTIASKYKVESLLGEGGMAQVFKARHMGLDRPVVIKLMHSSLPSMDTALKRFEQECKITAKIDHPNVVSVFDVGTFEEGRPYLVMEFIQGESLRDYLDREVSMNIKDAVVVMSQICSGLHEAHTQGIIHRDLKPENIMLRQRADRPDWVKIVDFGIAHLKQGGLRLTKTGIAIGTVDYMSPEYLSDKPVDQRADVYALGVIFFELVAGRCPFVAETTEAVMAKHLWGTAMPLSHYRPDLTAGSIFDRIAARALEKEPSKRYQSVEEMKLDLNKALKEYGIVQS